MNAAGDPAPDEVFLTTTVYRKAFSSFPLAKKHVLWVESRHAMLLYFSSSYFKMQSMIYEGPMF